MTKISKELALINKPGIPYRANIRRKFSQQEKEALEAMNYLNEIISDGFGPSLELYITLSNIKTAVNFGQGAVLIEGLKSYPERLLNAFEAIKAGYDRMNQAMEQINATLDPADHITYEQADLKHLEEIVNKYLEGLRLLINPQSDKGQYLRDITPELDRHLGHIKSIRGELGRPGRPSGITTLTQRLGEHCDIILQESPDLSWPDIGEQLLKTLLNIPSLARSSTDVHMIDWLKERPSREELGRQLHRKYTQWKKKK